MEAGHLISRTSPGQYRIGFIVEQALGHVTHGQNLNKNVLKDASVEAWWGFPSWQKTGLAGRIPLYKNNWTVQAGLQTRRILAEMRRRVRLDALFFHTQVTAVLSLDWLRKIPSVVSLDATPRQYDRLGAYYAHRSGPEWLERQKWRLNRDSFRLARSLVTWSEWAKQGLVDEYEAPADKIHVIPPGVETRSWSHPGDRSHDGQPLKILFVGADLERKGGLLLIDSFRTLYDEFTSRPPVQRATGGVELHLVTKSQVPDQPGVVVYHDMQPNSSRLKRLFWESDIFCLPTYGDCLPMVLSEAGAAGLPLVSTRVAAVPEIVIDGQTGLLTPTGDAAALTAVLRQLLLDGDLRRRMGTEASRVVQGRYDSASNASRLLELLKTTADQGRQKQGLL
jgi:glycosyltransferase involved in cell wall biosynthesis